MVTYESSKDIDIEAQWDECTCDGKTVALPIPVSHKINDSVVPILKAFQVFLDLYIGEELQGSKQHAIFCRTSPGSSSRSGTSHRCGKPIGKEGRQDITARVPVLSEKELATWRACKLNDFERLRAASGFSKEANIDVWKDLQHINRDWKGLEKGYPEVTETFIPCKYQEYPHPLKSWRYLGDEIVRCDFQREFFYGLSRWWLSQPGKLLTAQRCCNLEASPWIALMGLRMATYSVRETIQNNQPAHLDMLRILVALLDLELGDPFAPRKTGPDVNIWAEHISIGQVLDQCYRHRVLGEPERGDDNTYRAHLAKLIQSLDILNLWKAPARVCIDHQLNVSEIRNMKVAELCEAKNLGNPNLNGLRPMSQEATFQCHELSLELLRTVGRLKIEWTEYLEEHLQLDAEKLTLKIFWFGFYTKASPVFSLGCGQHLSQIENELAETYSLLFRSRKDNKRDNIEEYGRLNVPLWLQLCFAGVDGADDVHKANKMSYFLQPRRRLSDMDFHLAGIETKLPPNHAFAKYRIWGDHLRVLKAYMDRQKPGGIRALWADRRDSYGWYTLWAVLIIGGFSLILSFLSLVAAVVQVEVTLKGLGPYS